MSLIHTLSTWVLVLHVFSFNDAKYLNVTHVREEILDYLDVPDKQAQLNRRHDRDVPSFMKELYRQKVKNQKAKATNASEMVHFFFPKGLRARRTKTLNYEFKFNISSIRFKDEKLTSSVIRLYRRRTKTRHVAWLCSVALFLQPRGMKRKGNKSRKVAPIFADIKVVPLSGKSLWLQFNVSKVVKDQLKGRRSKQLHFKVYVTAYGASLPPKGWISRHGINRPNLVVYSRLKKNKRKTLSLDLIAMADSMTSMKSREKRGNKNEFCQRRRYYVNFRSLDINWIIAPVGFSAYLCEGACPELLTSYYEPTNHAILQNLLHYRYSKHIPQVSCVPTRLHALTMLMYDDGLDEGNQFVVREFPGMIASRCGCR